jgi:hypothetical protein
MPAKEAFNTVSPDIRPQIRSLVASTESADLIAASRLASSNVATAASG